MAKQSSRSAPAGTTTKLYEYIVLHVKSKTELTRLGIAKARSTDDAMAQFADYDPKDLAAVSKARWTERKDVCLRNKPELDLGTQVEVSDGQMELDAA